MSQCLPESIDEYLVFQFFYIKNKVSVNIFGLKGMCPINILKAMLHYCERKPISVYSDQYWILFNL